MSTCVNGVRRSGTATAVTATAVLALLASMVFGCGRVTADARDVTAVVPLARTGDWRPGLAGDEVTAEGHVGLLEIAYTAQEAQALWQANVPDDLPQRANPERLSGSGLYGGLETVDMDRYVVAAWHAGEGSDCPRWLERVGWGSDGRPIVEVATTERTSCREDFEPYSMVVAIPRDHVPDRRDLPLTGFSDEPGPLTVRFVPHGT